MQCFHLTCSWAALQTKLRFNSAVLITQYSGDTRMHHISRTKLRREQRQTWQQSKNKASLHKKRSCDVSADRSMPVKDYLVVDCCSGVWGSEFDLWWPNTQLSGIHTTVSAQTLQRHEAFTETLKLCRKFLILLEFKVIFCYECIISLLLQLNHHSGHDQKTNAQISCKSIVQQRGEKTITDCRPKLCQKLMKSISFNLTVLPQDIWLQFIIYIQDFVLHHPYPMTI